MADPAMNSLMRHRRLLETLRSAEQALRARDDATSITDRAALSASLDRLHLELGRELHRMFRGEASGGSSAIDATPPTADVAPRRAATPRPATPPPPLPRLQPSIAPELEDTPTPHDPLAESTTQDDDDTPLSTAPVDRSWVRRLRGVLRTYALAEGLEEPSDLALEAARVQCATRDVSGWARFPNAIQVALLGAFAARARHLQASLQSPVPAELALQRLREYRRQAGLSWVTGLVADRGPEHDTWAEDAAHWWKVLVEGLGVRSGVSA